MSIDKSAATISLTLDVPEPLEAALSIALARATYLYPDLQFEVGDGALAVTGSSALPVEEVRKDLMYLLYREHIRVKFEPFRRRALDRIYGSVK